MRRLHAAVLAGVFAVAASSSEVEALREQNAMLTRQLEAQNERLTRLEELVSLKLSNDQQSRAEAPGGCTGAVLTFLSPPGVTPPWPCAAES